MKTASRTGCQLLVVGVCLTATAAATSHKPPSGPASPPTENARGKNDGPTLPTPRKRTDRSRNPTSKDPRTRKPEPQPIELSGRLHRPPKWSPQLQLFPAGQIKRFDLRGKLLRDIKEGTPIRVRGVVRSSLHRGGTKDNPSAIPAQWIIWLEVTKVDVLEDPRDVLKKQATTLRRSEAE